MVSRVTTRSLAPARLCSVPGWRRGRPVVRSGPPSTAPPNPAAWLGVVRLAMPALSVCLSRGSVPGQLVSLRWCAGLHTPFVAAVSPSRNKTLAALASPAPRPSGCGPVATAHGPWTEPRTTDVLPGTAIVRRHSTHPKQPKQHDGGSMAWGTRRGAREARQDTSLHGSRQHMHSTSLGLAWPWHECYVQIPLRRLGMWPSSPSSPSSATVGPLGRRCCPPPNPVRLTPAFPRV